MFTSRTATSIGSLLLVLLAGTPSLAGTSGRAAPPDSSRRPLAAFDPDGGRFLTQYLPPDVYNASPENWEAVQDDRGLFYVGNTEGVLIYDGHTWRTAPTANQTSVQSLARSEAGTIFVGATSDFGVMRPDSVGRMQYVSLLDHVSEADRSFEEVRRVVTIDGDVYFMTPQRLFRWEPDTESITSWISDRGRFASLNVVRDTPYVAVDESGLATVTADTLRPVRGGEALSNRGITFTMGLPDRGLLVGTKQGLLVQRGDSLRPFAPGVDVQDAWTRTAARLPDGTIAVATIRSGIFLLAPDGTLRRHLPARDNPTLGLHVDREGGLWALQYGGMIRYDVGAPVTVHGSETGIQGTPVEIDRHRGVLHVATTRSLYRLRPNEGAVASFNPFPAVARKGDEVQCWSLLFDGDQTFVGTTLGLVRIGPNDQTEHLTPYSVYDVVRARSDSGLFYAATSRGPRRLRRTSDGWSTPPLRPEFDTEVRHLLQDSTNTLWATSNQGVYRFRGLGPQAPVAVESFGTQHNLPGGAVWLYRWQGTPVFGTSTGPMRFTSAPTPRFTPLDRLDRPPGADRRFVYLAGGTSTEAWGFVRQTGPGRWVRRDSTWRWRPGRLARFNGEKLYTAHVEDGGGVVWFGTRDGRLLRYVPDGGVPRSSPPPRIRRVHTLTPDSIVTADGSSASPATLPFARNSLRVTYGVPTLVQTDAVRYQHRLEGAGSTAWSDWTGRTEQVYRNLSHGTHTVAVRARTAYGDTTAPARYSFTVLPPWYRTWWAYGLYLLAAAGVVAGIVRWRTHRLRRRQQQLERAVTDRTREIERQKQQLADQADKLKELDEAKTRFFANVSHEFRTPLTLILGPAEDLYDRVRRHLSAEDAEQLSVIQRNARRLLRLVDQILGIARMEADSYQLDARPTRLDEAAERIVDAFEPMAERKTLVLTFDADDASPPDARQPVYVDPDALEHILSNLISNAIKFTPNGGTVGVTFSSTDDAATLTVDDTGPGIPEEEQDAIFDRFQQGKESAAREQEGAGIGLAFTRDLVQLHGGTINLTSADGEGTTVTVRFPYGRDHLADEHLDDDQPLDDRPTPPDDLAPTEALPDDPEVPAGDGRTEGEPSLPEEPDAQPDDAPDETPADDQTKIVLVVDDNADVRQYIRSVLEPSFTVLEAADGAAGVEMAREHLPDVILADVMMPNVDGHEMTRHLKDDPDTKPIPVIMVTARAGTGDEVEGLKVGADDYITKPFDADVLRQRVTGVVALKERLRASLDAASSPPSSEAEDDDTSALSEIEQDARAVIQDHVSDSDFGVDELAEALHMGRSTLYRRFNEHTDRSPSDLITAVRMERATELLRNGESVTQVAYAVGFDRLASFSRAFKDYAGQPPSAVHSEPA